MISTLIRGSSTPPPTNRYREEYLVDTETNEIIYPKVLPSSITIPPNISGDGGTSIPGIGGSINPNSYITETKSIVGTTVPSQTVVNFAPFDYEIESDGIYLVAGTLEAHEINRSCSITIHNVLCEFGMVDVSSTKFPIVAGSNLYCDRSHVVVLKKFDKGFKFIPYIYLQYKETCVIRSGEVTLDLIKLCDL